MSLGKNVWGGHTYLITSLILSCKIWRSGAWVPSFSMSCPEGSVNTSLTAMFNFISFSDSSSSFFIFLVNFFDFFSMGSKSSSLSPSPSSSESSDSLPIVNVGKLLSLHHWRREKVTQTLGKMVDLPKLSAGAFWSFYIWVDF